MTERGALRVDAQNGGSGNVCLVTCALASHQRKKAMTLNGGDTVRYVVAKKNSLSLLLLYIVCHSCFLCDPSFHSFQFFKVLFFFLSVFAVTVFYFFSTLSQRNKHHSISPKPHPQRLISDCKNKCQVSASFT